MDNRSLVVYVTTNRKVRVYQAAPMSLHELLDRLKASQTIPYAVEAYMSAPTGKCHFSPEWNAIY